MPVMTWLVASAVALVFLFLFAAPCCHGFRLGIASARDPAHRVVPQSPWIFFGNAFRHSIRWWRFFWLAALLGAAIGGGFALPQEASRRLRLLQAGEWACVLLGMQFLVAAACLLVAGRFASIWLLTTTALCLAIALYCLLTALVFFCVPTHWLEVEILEGNVSGGGYWIFLFAYYNALGAGLTLVWLTILTRRRGEGWFRFER